MIKTATIVFILCLLAGFAILRAVRAMKRHISSDATESDDWTGAKRFGGKLPGEKPPPEEEIRRAWTPVRAPTETALGRPDGNVAELREAKLRKYVSWCDKRCNAGWLIVLPVNGAATIWFQDIQDAQAFARNWHPLAGT